jgi:hypothetical protein
MAALKHRTKSDVRRDWNNSPTRFLHGTTTVFMNPIRRDGLRVPYFASTFALAAYYAEVACDEQGGDPVVLECLDVDRSLLRLDNAALSDPVGCDDGCVEAACKMADRDHPELAGKKGIPQELWLVSWAGVGSARYTGVISNFVEHDIKPIIYPGQPTFSDATSDFGGAQGKIVYTRAPGRTY